MALYSLLEKTTVGTAQEKAKTTKEIENFLKPNLRHLNCAKSFKRLFETNPVEAKAVRDGAVSLMLSIS